MRKFKKVVDKITETDYYECPRCDISSLTSGRMCPCPRGGCDAIIVGTIVTTTSKVLNTDLSKEQAEWNKDRLGIDEEEENDSFNKVLKMFNH